MPRWEPNAQQRLMRAALDLFTEKGYDATTINEIADRAGLTKTTFFRHFSDKREVLFAGQDQIPSSSARPPRQRRRPPARTSTLEGGGRGPPDPVDSVDG